MLFRCGCYALLALSVHSAENWPQFRGPDGKGIAAGNPPLQFSPNGPAQVWKAAVPFGQSSPAIWGDHIYLTSGDRNSTKLVVLALNRTSGEQVWADTLTVEKLERTHSVASPASATVLADSERIYVYFGSSGLLSYDHAGKRLWSVRLPLPEKLNGSGSSPVLAGELVLLNRDDPEEAYLLAVDRKTGKQVWKQSYGEISKGPGVSNTSTPLVHGSEVVVHRAVEVIGMSVETGEKRWSIPVQSTGVGTPVSDGSVIYVSTWNNVGEPELRRRPPSWEELLEGDLDGDGALAATELPKVLPVAERPGVNHASAHVNLPPPLLLSFADANKDGKLGREEYAKLIEMINKMAATEHGLLAIHPRAGGGEAEARVAWKYSRNVAEVPTPLVYAGRVYMVTNGGILTCVDAATGKLVYRSRLDAPGAYYASPIAAGDRIYFASGEGMITVVRPADTLQVVARNDLGEPVHATPAIIGDVIYVRTAAHLFSFALKAQPAQ